MTSPTSRIKASIAAHLTPPEKRAPATEDEKGPESFGAYLIQERELRGMSLERIAEETRILASNLRALEEDDQARLPARVFVVGYIRAYAQVLGLDANEAVLRYDEYSQGQRLQSEPPVQSRSMGFHGRRWQVVVVVIALAALVLILALAFQPARPSETATPPAVSAAPAPQGDGADPKPAPTSGAPEGVRDLGALLAP